MSDRWAKNWELHDGAEEGYEDAVMDSSSELDIPLAKISQGNQTTAIPISHRKRPTLSKLTNRGNIFLKKKTNQKNGDQYFNPVKEAIVDSSDHTVTLEYEHILRKSDLAIKEKIRPGTSKILVNTRPEGTDSSCFPSLAGKSKSSPPKKSTSAYPQKKTTCGNSTCGNPTSTQTNTNPLTEVSVIPKSPQKSSGSFASSSLNLNSWDGLISESFEDVSNNNAPFNQESYNNLDLSFTGEEIPSGPSVAAHSSSLPGPSSSGSASEPIVLDSLPEETPRIATQTRSAIRPRRNVGPPQFYGELRYVDIVESSETQHGNEISSLTTLTFLCGSSFDFFTPLTKPPNRQMLVADTTLTWSSKSTPTVNAQTTYLTPTSWKSPSGKFPNIASEQDSVSENSSTIEQDLRQSLDEFDAGYN